MNDKMKNDDDIERKDILVEARVPLVGMELSLRNLAHAEIRKRIDDATEAEKARAKLARGEIARLEADATKLMEDVISMSETGMIEGFELWNYRLGEVGTFRCDTGQQITVRPMSAEERSAWKEPVLFHDVDDASKPANGEQKLVLRGRKPKPDAAKDAH